MKFALSIGVPGNGFLNGGKEIRYTLVLAKQEVAFIILESIDLRGSITIFDPDGVRLKGSKIDSDGSAFFAFVADTAGRYEVQLCSEIDSELGSYTLTLEQVLTLNERVRPAPMPRLESTRIRQLRLDLEAHSSQALTAFWQEVYQKGTPLLELDPADPQLILCTFLWREAEHTRNVRLHLLYRTTIQNECTMVQLEDTDVWYTTICLPSQGRFAYTLLVNTSDMTPPNIDSAQKDKALYLASSQADPLNPRRCFAEEGSRYETMSLLELPDAPPQPWTDVRPKVDRGNIERYPFKSSILNDDRYISIYTPPGYSEKAPPYGLIFVFDDQWFLTRVPTATILDNLLADEKIPPMVAVLIGNGPGDARNNQLTCNVLFADFMANELMPWVQSKYNVTEDPRRTIVAGASYGGLAASYVAMQYPELFGNVLSQSGSYWWHSPAKPEYANANRDKEPNYMAALFVTSPRLALRFYMDAGSGEIDLTGNGRSILSANRHLRDVLLAKGYEVHYREFIGGHDFLSWRGTLADGLMLLTKPWTRTEV